MDGGAAGEVEVLLGRRGRSLDPGTIARLSARWQSEQPASVLSSPRSRAR